MADERGTMYFAEGDHGPQGWQIICANCGKVFPPIWSRHSGDATPYRGQVNPPASRDAQCPECWQLHVQEIPANPVMLKSAVQGDGNE